MKQEPSSPSFADIFLGQRKTKRTFFSRLDSGPWNHRGRLYQRPQIYRSSRLRRPCLVQDRASSQPGMAPTCARQGAYYPQTTVRSPYQPSASIFVVKSSINRTMRHKLKKNKIVMRTIEVKKTPKEPRWVIDPETGEKVSRTFLAMREIRKKGGLLRVIDMDAVLE